MLYLLFTGKIYYPNRGFEDFKVSGYDLNIIKNSYKTNELGF